MNAATEQTGTETPSPRHAKGKRPDFYAAEGMDEAMSMIMVLASELCTMRDRMDTVEQIALEKGIDLGAEIDDFSYSPKSLNQREERRQAFFNRLFYVTQKKALEQATEDSSERYQDVLRDTAKG